MTSSTVPDSLRAALSARTLPSLDGLRACAVLLVVLYHFGFAAVNGGQGVLIFFVISGFLITWLLLQEEARWGAVSLRLFYLRRTLRIFPAFYVYWALVVGGFLVLGKRVHLPQAWASLLYVNDYYQAIAGDPNTALSHTWSLAIEEQFYLLWPGLFVVLRTPARRLRALLWAIAAVWVYRIVMVTVVGVRQGYVYEAFEMRSDHLMIGCALATALFCGAGERVWRSVCATPAALWLTAVLFAASSAMPSIVAWRYRDMVGFIVDPLLVAVFLIQALAFARTSAAWLNVMPLAWVGRLSYSIYLYQQVTLEPVRHALAGMPVAVQLVAALVVCISVAAVSYYAIERPFLVLKDRVASRRPVLASRAMPASEAPGVMQRPA